MLEIGALFSRYQIEAELGAGGMGRVYRALDTRLQRRVALKVLLLDPVFSSTQHGEASARLIREARAAAAFEHPNKVSVFDVGVHEGTPYIAMELVAGRPLRAFVGDPAIPLSARLTWLVAIARVLSAAHAVGLVHRDVKPENVMIRDDGDVKILDFGIARRVAQTPDGDAPTLAASIPTLTGAGVSIGTPIYMAPEQIKAEDLDGRVDQFAWGTMAYELITGRHPWAAGRDLAGAIGAIVAGSTPDFPPELGLSETTLAVIRKTLSKLPAERFSSFDEAVAALQSSAQVAPAGTVPLVRAEARGLPSFVPEPSDFALPNTTKGVAASVAPAPARVWRFPKWAIALALVAAAFGVWLAMRKAPTSASLEPAVGLATLGQFHDVVGSQALAFESASLWRAAAQDFERVLRHPGAPARWRAALAFCEGRVLRATQQEDLAVGKLQRAVELDPEWALARSGLCGALAHTGDLDGALKQAAQAERIEPAWWGGPAAAARANAYNGKLVQAIEDYRRALALAPERPILLSELALVYHASHIDSEAERLAQRALQLDPELVSPRVLLAERALEAKDGETALREANRALALLPQSLPALIAQADALVLLDRSAEAEAAFRRALLQWKGDGDRGPFDERMRAVEGALAQGRLPTRSVEAVDRSATPGRTVADAAPRSPVLVPPRSPAALAPRSPVAAKPGSLPRAATPGGADVGF